MLYLVKATGESMRFVINNGDMLLLQADSKPLKFGDVIVYRDNCREGLVCHRYYFRIGKWLITAGDNCLRFELVNKDRFYGYVVVSTGRNGDKYDLNKQDAFKRKFSWFTISFIIVSNVAQRVKLPDAYIKKMLIKKTRMQIRYLQSRKLKT